jgi:hypothetical protein
LKFMFHNCYYLINPEFDDKVFPPGHESHPSLNTPILSERVIPGTGGLGSSTKRS